MAIPGGIFIALALSFASAGEPFEHIPPGKAAERAALCGLGPVTIRYEDELQSDVLVVANTGAASESQLECLDEATRGNLVELPPHLQSRFDAVRGARVAAIMLAEARKWLSERGLLERVPRYVPGRTDEAAFTREVEALCGPRARGAFQSQYGFHALSPTSVQRLGMSLTGEEGETFACLSNVTPAAGFEVGLIGHAAVRTTE